MAKQRVTRTLVGQALEDLMVEITYAFFPLRARGLQIGTNTTWGGSYWGMLRSLKLEGPLTVSQIARSRPVPRQSIQKLANEMLKDGLIELINNPDHKRSKLLRLTLKGEAIFEEFSEQIAQDAEAFAQTLEAVELADLKTAVTVLHHLRQKLKESLTQIE
jgi:DNA-binding MarR family transcriptional regulator